MTESSSRKISVAGAAEMGSIKTVNEDAYESHKCGTNQLYLIASGNGTGTSGKGKVALDMVLAAFGKTFKEFESNAITHEEIVNTIREVNRAVFERSLEEPKYAGMAVSLSLILIAEERAYVVHVGNTRVYMISGARIEQLTKDHTLAEELKRTGAVGATNPSSPMAQVLTRAIGKAPHIEPDVFSFSLADLDDNRLVACTKGVYSRLEDHELLEDLLDVAPDVALSRTIKLAKDKSPADNLALVVLDPNGYKAAGSGAISEISEVKVESSEAKSDVSQDKDAIPSSANKKVDFATPKLEDKKLENNKDGPGNSNSSMSLSTGAQSKTSDSPLFSQSGTSSSPTLSSASRSGPSVPSSPLSALVAPSLESTEARAGLNIESSSSQDGTKSELAQRSSGGVGGSGNGQVPKGFEQESSGHLKPRGAGFGPEGAGSVALGGLGGDVAQSREGRSNELSSRKTSTSLETTVAGRGQPQFDDDDDGSKLDEGAARQPRGALSKLSRAIFVGIIGGTLLGRIFNSPPSELEKPAVNQKQQVVDVKAKSSEKKSDSIKGLNGPPDIQARDQGAVINTKTVNEAPSEEVRVLDDLNRSREELVEGVKTDSLNTQEASGLDRALGRKTVTVQADANSEWEGIKGVDSQPEQSMKARAGVTDLVKETESRILRDGTYPDSKRGQSTNSEKGQGVIPEIVRDGELAVEHGSGSQDRALEGKRAVLPERSAQITANEVLNKFPQLSKISDPDLRLMLTDVLSAFEETAQISKQELVEVEAERQRLNARLEVLERLILKNVAQKEGRVVKPQEAQSAGVVAQDPVAEQAPGTSNEPISVNRPVEKASETGISGAPKEGIESPGGQVEVAK